jgi:4-amino-4-deoxy-L-arabinose transferase-like glycosyltransferase
MSHAVVRFAGSAKIGAAIFVLALIFRLLMLLWFPLPNMEYVDESEYFALGQNLRFHQVFSFGAPHLWGQHAELNAPGPFVPTAARPPLYPLLIAILWWGDAPPYLSLALAQIVLGSLVALLVYLVALRALGLPVAIVAGLGMALAPESASYVTIALTETLYTFLLIGFVWLWGKQRGFQAGLLLGAAALVRSNAIVLVPLIGLMGLVWSFNRTVHLRIALAAVLVIAPWVARNHATQHEFTPIATYGWGSVLFYSTVDVPYYSGNPFTVWLADKEAEAIYAGALTLESAERRLRRAALERIAKDPIGYLWNRVTEYPRNFLDHGVSFMPIIPLPKIVVKSVFLAASVIFVTLSLWGLYLARKEWRRTYFIALVPFVFAGMQIVGAANLRYSIPLVPPMLVFAALAACHVWTLAAKAIGDRRLS